MTVTVLASEDVVTAAPETSLAAVASETFDRDVGSVEIVDDDERPVGIVTDRDLTMERLRRRSGRLGLACVPHGVVVSGTRAGHLRA